MRAIYIWLYKQTELLELLLYSHVASRVFGPRFPASLLSQRRQYCGDSFIWTNYIQIWTAWLPGGRLHCADFCIAEKNYCNGEILRGNGPLGPKCPDFGPVTHLTNLHNVQLELLIKANFPAVMRFVGRSGAPFPPIGFGKTGPKPHLASTSQLGNYRLNRRESQKIFLNACESRDSLEKIFFDRERHWGAQTVCLKSPDTKAAPLFSCLDREGTPALPVRKFGRKVRSLDAPQRSPPSIALFK